jgi:hypothetical protein
MSIVLTEEQQQALDLQDEVPPRVIDLAYYLVTVTDYEAVRESAEEEKRQKAIRTVGLGNAVGKMEETP